MVKSLKLVGEFKDELNGLYPVVANRAPLDILYNNITEIAERSAKPLWRYLMKNKAIDRFLTTPFLHSLPLG